MWLLLHWIHRLDEISKIEDYFIDEINREKSCSYNVRLHRQDFNCLKCNNRRNINYFNYKCYWSTCRNSKCKLYFNFSLEIGIIKILLNTTRKKKEIHDKILMLARSKLNSIEISQAFTDMDISHEEFITILEEKDRYEMMKDNLRDKNEESYKVIKFNSEKPKN